MKINKRLFVLSIIISLLPIVVGILLFDKLPAKLPSHWNAQGVVDNYSNKYFVLFNMPIVLAIINALMPLLMKLDPKYENMSNNLIHIILFVIPSLSLICTSLSIASAFAINIPVVKVILIFMGLIFILVGNYLPKTNQSYTMGIKLPWTLNSEENWNRTHRLGGFLFVVYGVATIILALLLTELALYLFLIMLIIVVLIPCIYSYLLYRKGI